MCQVPFTSLTTNVPSRPAVVPTPLLVPAALQLPGEAHATAETSTSPSPVTGSVMALCQIPLTSSTTNALAPFGPTYLPPALQSPGCVHDTELMNPFLPVLRASTPGTGMALCQVPFTSLTTNG